MSLFIRVLLGSLAITLALACGGGGGGGSSSADGVGTPSVPSGASLKARFKATELYNVLSGDRLVIYRLGDSKPLLTTAAQSKATRSKAALDVPDLALATPDLTVIFELNTNYILAIDRLGVNFLSTIITADQISAASQLGYLDFGALNAMTTYLVHEIEPQTTPLQTVAVQQGLVNSTLTKYFHASVTMFPQVTFARLTNNTITKTPAFYTEAANRVNAMTAYAMILKDVATATTTVSSENRTAMGNLYTSILTGTLPEWITASEDAASQLSDLTSIDFSANSTQLLSADDSGVYVFDGDDLQLIFFNPIQAQNLFLFDLALPATPSSLISGVITGPGAAGTKVEIHRAVKIGLGYATQSVVTSANGIYSFAGLDETADYKLSAQQRGIFYKAGETVQSKTARGKVVLSTNLFSFDLADYVDETTIEMTSGNLLRVKDGGITSAKLANDIKVTGNFTVGGSSNLGGLLLPSADGTNGQVLTTNGQGQLAFSAASVGTVSSTSNVGTLGLQSANAVAVTGGTITGTAITGGTITGTAITGGAISGVTGSMTSLVVTGASNIGGLLLPLGDGTVGQFLKTDGAGNLSFATVTAGSSFSGANVADVETITGNWVNTANPWADNEVADDLTIAGGTVNSTAIGATTASTGNFTSVAGTSLVVTGSTNLKGLLMPSADGTVGQYLKTDGNGNLSFDTVASGAGTPGTNTITSAMLADGNVTTAQILDGTILAADLGVNSVTEIKIADGSVTTAKLGVVVISAANITNDVISSANIVNLSIVAADLASDSVTTSKIADGSVTSAKLGAFAISAANITNDVISSANIVNGGVANVDLAADAVTTDKIAPGAVGTTDLADGSVTTAKLGVLTISAANITNDVISSANIVNGGVANVDLAADAVTTDKIAPGAVGTTDLADGSVTTAKLGVLTISAANITNDVISSANIVNGSIATVDLANNSVTSAILDNTLAISGNFTASNNLSSGNLLITGSANIAGMLYPTVGGSTNSFLMSGGANNLLTFVSANQILGSTNISSLALQTPSIAGASIVGGTITSSTLTTPTINGGAINTTTIGLTTAGAGNFTTSTINSAILTSANVSGNTILGSGYLSSNLIIGANVTGMAAGGNIWFSGNLMSMSNTYSLGTADKPWREIYAIDLVTTSDERLKRDIEPIPYGLDEVMKLRPVTYEWNNNSNKGRTIGLLAQEVEEVIDEAVSVANDENQTRGIRYYNMVPVLIKAIQDQQKIIGDQQKALELQGERLERLEQLK